MAFYVLQKFEISEASKGSSFLKINFSETVLCMAQYILRHNFLMPRSHIQDFAMTWYMTNGEHLGLSSLSTLELKWVHVVSHKLLIPVCSVVSQFYPVNLALLKAQIFNQIFVKHVHRYSVFMKQMLDSLFISSVLI